MRKVAEDTSTNILQEQFIPDNVFMYVMKGIIQFFDGSKNYTLKAGEYGIARKNSLAKYILLDNKDEFEPIIFCFDEEFLLHFKNKYKIQFSESNIENTIIKLPKSSLMKNFIRSLKPYYKGVMELDKSFEELKYEELLIILLKNEPNLSGILFDFSIPQKINLEEFMNRNFRFNVSNERFAYLTGRSLSGFKRDFKKIFNDTPNHWLVKKRLKEAYFLIDKKKQKPSDIYLDLGFESLSHFSVAFKNFFGKTPTELINYKNFA